MLVNGRATHAKPYPPELVKAVLKGLRKQLGVLNAAVYSLGGGATVDEEFFPSEEDQEAFCSSNVESGSDAIYYDANTGVVLDNDKVDARQDELGWSKRAEARVKRRITECLEVTGKQPTTLKWLDEQRGF